MKTSNQRNEHIKFAAEKGDVDSMYQLATLCYSLANSLDPLLEGYESARYWALKALESGHPWAGTLLGHLYSNPNFPGNSIDAAISYYRWSLSNGDPSAIEYIQELES